MGREGAGAGGGDRACFFSASNVFCAAVNLIPASVTAFSCDLISIGRDCALCCKVFRSFPFVIIAPLRVVSSILILVSSSFKDTFLVYN